MQESVRCFIMYKITRDKLYDSLFYVYNKCEYYL